MQKTRPYELNKTNAFTAVIAEQQEQYVDRFNAAVDEFNVKLQYIDKNSSDPKARQDELLLVTTKAIMAMGDACEHFERACAFDKTLIKEAQRSFRERTRSGSRRVIS